MEIDRVEVVVELCGVGGCVLNEVVDERCGECLEYVEVVVGF